VSLRRSQSESRMPEIGTSGLTSGDGKRGGAQASVLAPVLDSTDAPHRKAKRRREESRRCTQECVRHICNWQMWRAGGCECRGL
jgi:hypothetical protein